MLKLKYVEAVFLVLLRTSSSSFPAVFAIYLVPRMTKNTTSGYTIFNGKYCNTYFKSGLPGLKYKIAKFGFIHLKSTKFSKFNDKPIGK
jgi:hypothetical protein